MYIEKEIRSIWKIVILHLLPGIMLSIVYMFLIKVEILSEYPKIIILGLSIISSIVPIMLGYLFFIAKKEECSFNIFKILGLKSKMKKKEFIFYTLLLFLITGILMTCLKPLSDCLLNTVFSFIPSRYIYIQDLSSFGRGFIIIAIVVSFFIFTLIGPIVEELYFRGYLLARMKWMGNYGVLIHVILFAVYHFWSPWLIVARVVVMLPLYYFVYKKDSLKLAISVHCIANFTDFVGLVMLL